MKKILILLLVLFAIPSKADDLYFCEMVGVYSGKVMGARQSGVSLSQALDDAKELGEYPRIITLLTSIVMEAYEKPRYATDRRKLSIESEFKDSWHLRCLQTVTM